ncbi:beta-glucoside-specific PTS transporter subunit IIABC [Streptococcus uberis]|uniref:beta-glucoside-specific PTS transporter subunit IIABC n=1 Tax=Streptococcus uberis TaxID=1349 RepID=UPI001FF409C3|nr:beta-glucoside-specific PTS transporter subunit IIABC [Streptococcus uberis]MCK1210608.1 beta-glucoside-specific PTS transporter subunit IIABC [Streptococcus uberis]MCK1215927.1 beta-glucoside-specific PTS transporter subunit IIABC [Streptococcus uberis]MCK1221745.1 beta-glucoside-specific PTS transporter subunit IIABC [Streptococcus uberis]
MSRKYQDLARHIIQNLGGKDNIIDVYHCQTRLRFKVKQANLVEKEKLEHLDGVTMYLFNAGVHQVVIGTHVKEVFEEVEALVDLQKENQEVIDSEKLSPIQSVISFVAAVFQPIIPALSGAGMVKAVLALLVVFKVITITSQTYLMLNTFADGIFYFLPLILAYTTAQKLKTNPVLAIGVVAMMLHPNWVTLVTAGKAVNFFGIIPFTLVTYSSSVIPAILVVFVQSYIEKFFYRHIPKSVELVFVPMFTFLVMGTLAFSILGPIGALIGKLLADVFIYLSQNISWLPPVLIGSFLPLMVMFGIHNAVAPLGIMQMAQLGFDSIFGPGALVSNMAQATAASVVAFRTQDEKMKQIATSGAITGYMGITEPILYGVSLPKKYPLYASMAGGALGGLYAGLTHVHRFATGSSGLPAVLLYIGDNSMRFFWNIMIAILITVVSTAIITYLLSLKYEKKESAKVLKETTMTIQEEVIKSPLAGHIKAIELAEDSVFASGTLGEGVVIDPVQELVLAPFSGKVVTVFPTKHAIGLESNKGAEVLIHIGINTVELQGHYFKSYVNIGDSVDLGQKLLSFDAKAIKSAGYNLETAVIVTNTANYKTVKSDKNGLVSEKEAILTLEVE